MELNKKGIAGLNVFLSVIIMLFMIGLIVMVFTLAGAKLGSLDVVRDIGASENSSCVLGVMTYTGRAISPTLVCYNYTGGSAGSQCGTPAGNYTVSYSAKTVTILPSATWNTTNVQAVYNAYTAASDAINDTYHSVGDAVDWFSTFIVLAVMIVLILLTVVIINSIRGSGIAKEGA